MALGTVIPQITLPYMNQPARDYALKQIPPSTVVPVGATEPTPLPPGGLLPPATVQPGPSPGQSSEQVGGPWYGALPPDSPFYGWLWINSNNDGLYVYVDPGVWVQTSTNW